MGKSNPGNAGKTEEQIAAQAAEKVAAEKAAAEKAADEKAASEKAAAEKAEAEKAAAEKAAAKKAATEKAAAEKAAATKAEAKPKNNITERAAGIFRNYPEAKELHFTSDGTPFFKASDAMNHAKGLQDKTITPINR